MKHVSFKIFSVVATLLIIIAIVNTFNTNGLKNIREKSTIAMDYCYNSVIQLSELERQCEIMQKYMNTLASVHNTDRFEATYQGYQKAADSMKDIIESLDPLILSLDDKAAYDLFLKYIEKVRSYGYVTASIVDAMIKNEEQVMLDSTQKMIDSINEINHNYEILYTKISEISSAASDAVNQQIKDSLYLNVTFGVVQLVIGIGICVFVYFIVARPIKRASNHIDSLIKAIDRGEGDLTRRISTKSKDEIGVLVNGFNTFVDRLQGIMKKVTNNSTRLDQSIDTINKEVSQSAQNINEVSATMEELAASMEEVSATVSELSTGVSSILDSVTEVANEAKAGNKFANTIEDRSMDMRRNAENGRTTTNEMLTNIRTVLKKSIANSENVDKINELTDDILAISSQTNLLALNASIEAARAGEAGKGFAVVAEQIRLLAENSRKTANNIQEISKIVTDAVSQLSGDSSQMLDFVDTNILKDYDDFVVATEQYSKDAREMNAMMERFMNNAITLEATISEMNTGIDGISVTIEESATGVTNIAGHSSDLVQMMTVVQQKMEENSDISSELKEEVNVFAII